LPSGSHVFKLLAPLLHCPHVCVVSLCGPLLSRPPGCLPASSHGRHGLASGSSPGLRPCIWVCVARRDIGLGGAQRRARRARRNQWMRGRPSHSGLHGGVSTAGSYDRGHPSPVWRCPRSELPGDSTRYGVRLGAAVWPRRV
jgi:hypothetical protein